MGAVEAFAAGAGIFDASLVLLTAGIDPVTIPDELLEGDSDVDFALLNDASVVSAATDKDDMEAFGSCCSVNCQEAVEVAVVVLLRLEYDKSELDSWIFGTVLAAELLLLPTMMDLVGAGASWSAAWRRLVARLSENLL